MEYNRIQKLVDKALSNKEVLKICGNKANLITYSELADYDNIEQAMGKYGACIVLYETKKDYGHWCCFFVTDRNTIEFFDPYGLMPDDEFAFVTEEFRRENGEYYPYLTAMLLATPYQIEYNHYPFQKFAKNVSSCGRWCGFRLLVKDLNLDEFIDLFQPYEDAGMDMDWLITAVTNLRNKI
jgi:hypothetical protein